MSVTTLHPDYQKRVDQWKTIRDCVEGEDAIKAARERYLPRASGSSDEQYEAFKKRARWNNYTARNLEGLHGFIFRKNPIITCSDEFKNSGILKNIDRRGTDIYQFISDSTFDSMQTSWGGYLVDMPTGKGVTTVLQAEQSGIRPYIRYYPAESIINWGYMVINGIEQLAYVVLKETVEDPNGEEFEHKPLEQYRVLDARSGVYGQRIFTESGTNKEGEIVFSEKKVPVTIQGEHLCEIPFVFIPGNKPEKPMFYDLAMCNIGHYQKSADYENGVHLTTIPTGYVTGHRQNRGPDGEQEVIVLGKDSFLMFEEENAKVGTLVFSGEGLTHSENAIQTALADMAVLGSRIIAPEKGTNESADSAKIHRAGENARLSTFAKNISERISHVLTIVAKWAGYNEEVTFSLNADYDSLTFDPNALNALANLAEAGKLPMPYVFWNLKNGEYAPNESDYEEYATLLQMEQSGMTPLEGLEYIKAKREGKKINISETENTPQKEVVNEEK